MPVARGDLEEIETAINVIAIPLFPHHRRVETVQPKENLMSLSAEEQKVARSFGMSLDEFARAKARRSAPKDTHGLTPEQLAIARSVNISPRALASSLARNGGRTAIAAGERREDSPGLLHAHQEVDRAHKADYDANAGSSSSVANTSDRELLDAALAALKKYDPNKDDDDNYDRLCTGAVYVMRLLNRKAK